MVLGLYTSELIEPHPNTDANEISDSVITILSPNPPSGLSGDIFYSASGPLYVINDALQAISKC